MLARFRPAAAAGRLHAPGPIGVGQQEGLRLLVFGFAAGQPRSSASFFSGLQRGSRRRPPFFFSGFQMARHRHPSRKTLAPASEAPSRKQESATHGRSAMAPRRHYNPCVKGKVAPKTPLPARRLAALDAGLCRFQGGHCYAACLLAGIRCRRTGGETSAYSAPKGRGAAKTVPNRGESCGICRYEKAVRIVDGVIHPGYNDTTAAMRRGTPEDQTW